MDRDEIMWRQGWLSAIEEVTIYVRNNCFGGVTDSKLLLDLLKEMFKNEETICKEKRIMLKKLIENL